MKKYIFLSIFLFFSQSAFAEEILIELAKAPVNVHDVASIKRGAKFFATICMSCHTLIYLKYDKLATEAGITLEKMPLNVKTWPNNVKPPDLSLEADVRGVDWIYTYLHSFYVDKSRPTGFNNLVHPNTAMPDMVAALQGMQILSPNWKETLGKYDKKAQWYDLVELQQQGSMTPEQFDATVMDVVNFLAYAADPYSTEQERLGWWVIGFLVVLLILSILLKREYWKDLKEE